MRWRSACGLMSTSSISSAPASTSSGMRSLTGAPVMVATASATDSRCWTLQRADDVDARVADDLHVLPALLARRPGHVGVGQLVDERDGRAGGRRPRRCPSPRRPRRGTRRRRRGTTSRPSSSSAVCGRPWDSTKPTTRSVPRVHPPVALLEHPVGLAHAGCHAQVHAQAAAPPAGLRPDAGEHLLGGGPGRRTRRDRGSWHGSSGHWPAARRGRG